MITIFYNYYKDRQYQTTQRPCKCCKQLFMPIDLFVYKQDLDWCHNCMLDAEEHEIARLESHANEWERINNRMGE
jgi:hypothetical protein